MSTQRLEAFSDGVIAIIITIMVLELKVPHEPSWHALKELLPIFLSYLLSFIYVGIYWNNHHHLMHLTPRVTGGILWANLHLLFWLSLVPFVTAWADENHFEPLPTAAYGTVLLMAALAFFILGGVIVRHEGRDSKLAKALGRDWKGKASIVLYALAIGLAFVTKWASLLYVFVAAMWLIPDRRMEKQMTAA
ncbi:MAG: TMEM175 family protein [Tepidisphaeraceae bacterium]